MGRPKTQHGALKKQALEESQGKPRGVGDSPGSENETLGPGSRVASLTKQFSVLSSLLTWRVTHWAPDYAITGGPVHSQDRGRGFPPGIS